MKNYTLKTVTAEKQINVSFTLVSFGNDHVRQLNAINQIVRKYSGQDNLYSNKPYLKFDKKGEFIGMQTGSTGGTIVFHAELCRHKEAAAELISLLASFGVIAGKGAHSARVIRFIRAHATYNAEAGSAYRCPQIFDIVLKKLNPQIL